MLNLRIATLVKNIAIIIIAALVLSGCHEKISEPSSSKQEIVSYPLNNHSPNLRKNDLNEKKSNILNYRDQQQLKVNIPIRPDLPEESSENLE